MVQDSRDDVECAVDRDDPYRSTSYDLPRTFTARERSIIASTARWMRVAGGLNLMLVGLAAGRLVQAGPEDVGVFQLLIVTVLGVMATLIWSAGRTLVRVQRSEQPYRELEASLACVRAVFRVKGMMLIGLMVLCGLTVVLSLVVSLLV